MKHIGGGIDAVTEPTTAAGRALLRHFDGRHGFIASDRDAILAIEAEARAAALDEVRAAIEAASWRNAYDVRPAFIAAIDALREGADKV